MDKTNGPLAGKKCLIMRNPSQAKTLVEGIKKLAGNPILLPLIAFRETPLSDEEKRVIDKLDFYDWIIFSSQNGVKFFMERLLRENKRIPQKIKFAAVGAKTMEALERYGIRIDFMPRQFTGKDMGKELLKVVEKGEKVCIIKGNLARNDAGTILQQHGIQTDEITMYETYFPEDSRSNLKALLQDIEIDLFIFTSPSTVEHFIETAAKSFVQNTLPKKIIACIGPVTKAALQSFGIPVHICPGNSTAEDLLLAIQDYFSN